MPDQDAAFLWDMLDAARQIRAFANDRVRDDLDNDAQFRLAVERGLEIIGVAASRVSTEYRAEHPVVPWQRIISLRNVIAHEYGDIILDQIWAVVTERIPELVTLLEPLVPPEED